MSTQEPLTIGLVSPSVGDKWLGGVYFLAHVVRAMSFGEGEPRVVFRELSWGAKDSTDPFAELRDALGEPVVVRLPASPLGRLARGVRRRLSSRRDPSSADLFRQAGIDVCFPIDPCENSGVPLIYWIPDLMFRRMPELYPGALLKRIEEQTVRSLRAARSVLVCSEASMQDVSAFYPEYVRKCRVVFLRSAPTPSWFASDPETTARRYGLPSHFLMISNQVVEHKNHATVVEAVRLLRGDGVNATIVCTGRLDEFRNEAYPSQLRKRVEDAGLSSHFLFLGAVPRTDQMALLRRAAAVIQPSLFEGWGAGIADSMALGKEIIASDIPVHREHGAASIRYVAPLDAKAWASEIERVVSTIRPGPDVRREAEALAANDVRLHSAGNELVTFFRECIRSPRWACQEDAPPTQDGRRGRTGSVPGGRD